MTNYNQIQAIRFSRLKLMEISPHHYRHHEVTETEAMRVGSATHLAVLEPERYHKEVAIWTGKMRRGKEWDAFQAEHEGQIILREQDHERAMLMSKAVHDDPHAARLLSGGASEVTREWADLWTGLKCKARLDYLTDRHVVDLKTTRHIRPRDFARQVAELHYHAQLAFYSASLLPCEVYIIAVTSEPPHDVVVYRLPKTALVAGRRLCDKWLAQVAECEASGVWPGIGGGEIQELKLPEWALADDTPRTLKVGGEEIEV
jgi:hypothetical protein